MKILVELVHFPQRYEGAIAINDGVKSGTELKIGSYCHVILSLPGRKLRERKHIVK